MVGKFVRFVDSWYVEYELESELGFLPNTFNNLVFDIKISINASLK